jgi:hypothetical protein
MNTPVLTIEERQNIESGAWFSKLSQPLRHAILSRAYVRRLSDGGPLASRGTPAEEWCGVARGAVRVSLVSLSGKQVTLTYCEPGASFRDLVHNNKKATDSVSVAQRSARTILNKFSRDNFPTLCSDFVGLEVDSLECLETVIKELFESALKQKVLHDLYGDLCGPDLRLDDASGIFFHVSATAEMDRLAAKHPSVAEGRAIGLFGTLDLCKNSAKQPLCGYGGSHPVMGKLGAFFRQEGLFTFLRPSGIMCNPPLSITEEQLCEGFAVIDRGLDIVDGVFEG